MTRIAGRTLALMAAALLTLLSFQHTLTLPVGAPAMAAAPALA